MSWQEVSRRPLQQTVSHQAPSRRSLLRYLAPQSSRLGGTGCGQQGSSCGHDIRAPVGAHSPDSSRADGAIACALVHTRPKPRDGHLQERRATRTHLLANSNAGKCFFATMGGVKHGGGRNTSETQNFVTKAIQSEWRVWLFQLSMRTTHQRGADGGCSAFATWPTSRKHRSLVTISLSARAPSCAPPSFAVTSSQKALRAVTSVALRPAGWHLMVARGRQDRAWQSSRHGNGCTESS